MQTKSNTIILKGFHSIHYDYAIRGAVNCLLCFLVLDCFSDIKVGKPLFMIKNCVFDYKFEKKTIAQ